MNTDNNTTARRSRDGCATLEDIALGADFLGLIEAFKLGSGFVSTDGLQIFAKNHSVADFRKLGWIEPAQLGHWQRGWKPAGKVAECLARCRSARNASEESDVIERGMAEVGRVTPCAPPSLESFHGAHGVPALPSEAA